MKKRIIFALFMFVSVSISPLCLPSAHGAPHPISVRPARLGAYLRSGVFIGGVAGTAFSLLRIQKLAADDGAERMVIVYGDADGQPFKGDPGYFHIHVDERAARVSIDLAQVQRTAVDPQALARVFADSNLVASTEMTMDPLDRSTNILLTLKRPAEVRAEVDRVRGSKALVIDLRALKRPVSRGGGRRG